MATKEEIGHRVEEVDTPRSARRTAAAQRIGELAERRAVIAKQLQDIEQQLGDVVVGVSDVMDIDELAHFTDVPSSDLVRWQAARKSARTKRKRSAGAPKTEPRRQPDKKDQPVERPSRTGTPGRVLAQVT